MDKREKVVMFNPQASPKMPYDGPPLSVLAAASCIDRSRYYLKVIDWHQENFEQVLSDECRDALVLGVTCMTGFQIARMLDGLRIARESNPGIKIVCGGWHATFLPEQTLQSPLIDFVVRGQGAWTFAELVDCIARAGDPGNIEYGIAFRRNGDIVVKDPPPIRPIKDFPPYPYDALERYEQFLVSTSFADKAAYLITSQGCPNNCRFCSEPSFHHRKWSGYPVERVIGMIMDMKDKYRIDGICIADPNFFVNEKRVAEFCRQLIPLGIRWGGTSSRSDQLARYSDETWELMRKSGLYDIFLGLESASDKTLEVMNKGCTVEDTLAVIPKAKKYGIRLQCALMIGVPGVDVEKDFKNNMAFINRMRREGGIAQFHMFAFIPYPGTPFLEESVKLGYKPPDSLQGWGRYDLHAHVTPWIPAKYPRITDQLSICFMALAGHTKRVVEVISPRGLLWLTRPMERVLYHLCDFRVTHSFFAFPLEYWIIKFVLNHKHIFFGKKKILF